MKYLLKKLPAFLLLTLLALTVWFPLAFLAGGSLMGAGELSARLSPVLSQRGGFARWSLLPHFPTLSPYVELLLDSPEFFVMFWNSARMAFLPLAGQLVTAVPAAWWFARQKGRISRALYTLYLVLMLMPFQVTMVSSYLVLDKAGLLDTQWSVILPALFSTFPIFIMYRFFHAIPQEVVESAQIDGAGVFGVFWHMALPIGKTGVISAMVLGFLEYWNLIEQPMTFLKTKSLWPLSLWLPRITEGKIALALAASVVILIPALLVFLCGQTELEQGIAAAGLKE